MNKLTKIPQFNLTGRPYGERVPVVCANPEPLSVKTVTPIGNPIDDKNKYSRKRDKREEIYPKRPPQKYPVREN